MQRRFETAIESFKTALGLDPRPAPRPQEARPGAGGARARSRGGRRARDLVRAGSEPPPGRGGARSPAGRAQGRSHCGLAQGAARKPRQRRCPAHARAGVLGRREARCPTSKRCCGERRSWRRPLCRRGSCLACCCMSRVVPQEAIECYQRAIEIEPGQRLGMVGARCGLRADRRHGQERRRLRAIPRAPTRFAGHSHELRACPEGARTPARGASRVSDRHRAETGLRRSVLEHGQSQGLPLRACGSRGHGRTGAARGPEPERRRAFPLRAGQGVRGRRGLRSRLGVLSHGQSAAAAARVLRSRWVSRPVTRRSRKYSAASSWTSMQDRASSPTLPYSSWACRARARR